MELLAQPTDTWQSEGFLQSPFWARFKSLHGWHSKAFVLSNKQKPSAGAASVDTVISVLLRPLFGRLFFAYVPHGPELQLPIEDQADFLCAAAVALKRQLGRFCVFIRFDPSWHVLEESSSNLRRPMYKKPLLKGSDVQPPDTVMLDISKPEEEILAGMKNKWRYNIRLADKKNVTVTEEGLTSLDTFLELYKTTAQRDGIALHSSAYYQSLFESARAHVAATDFPKPDVRLWVARFEGLALASIVTLFYGNQATYLYGASSDSNRNLMPAYALQWAAIKAAKAEGCMRYDMYGIPPFDDPSHPMAGLFRFKTGFGGAVLHYAGAWDFPYLSVLYYPYRWLEALRLFWFKYVKKVLTKRSGGSAHGQRAKERNDDEQ